MSTFVCNDLNCPALKRPVLPMGRKMAVHILYWHDGDKIVNFPEQMELDPDGTVGLAIIDRMLKMHEDFEKLLNKQPPYKAKFREPYYKLRAELVADVRAISEAAIRGKSG
jgi:hypothetical protein